MKQKKIVLKFFSLLSLLIIQQIRDPFVPLIEKASIVQQEIALVGVVQAGSRWRAILTCGDNRAVLEPGSQFEGYTLLSINKDSVVLNRDKKTKKLFME